MLRFLPLCAPLWRADQRRPSGEALLGPTRGAQAQFAGTRVTRLRRRGSRPPACPMLTLQAPHPAFRRLGRQGAIATRRRDNAAPHATSATSATSRQEWDARAGHGKERDTGREHEARGPRRGAEGARTKNMLRNYEKRQGQMPHRGARGASGRASFGQPTLGEGGESRAYETRAVRPWTRAPVHAKCLHNYFMSAAWRRETVRES